MHTIRANRRRFLMAAGAGIGLAAALRLPAPSQAEAATDVVVDFRERLAPHGRWVEADGARTVWFPTDVEVGWRPYMLGEWLWTDDVGWVWSGDEPWTWATDHYGTWYDDPVWGWVWVPGDMWGPAWVDWRFGDGFVGWAPLLPEFVRVRERVEIPEWSRWVFVDQAHFADRDVVRFAAPLGRNMALIDRTKLIGTVREAGGRVENRFIERSAIEAAAGRRLVPVRLADAADERGVGLHDGRLAVFRPRVSTSGLRAEAPVDRHRLARGYDEDQMQLPEKDRFPDEARAAMHAYHEHERFALRCQHGLCE